MQVKLYLGSFYGMNKPVIGYAMHVYSDIQYNQEHTLIHVSCRMIRVTPLYICLCNRLLKHWLDSANLYNTRICFQGVFPFFSKHLVRLVSETWYNFTIILQLILLKTSAQSLMRVHKVHFEIKLLKHVYQITTVIFLSVEHWSANPRLGVR